MKAFERLDTRRPGPYSSCDIDHLHDNDGLWTTKGSTSTTMASADTPADSLRRSLVEELTAYAPSRQMHLLRHWPGGRMSLVHLNVLFVLSAEGPLPMNRLAELLDVSQASATGIVDRMEQRGLVVRERDEEDRRVVRVALSPQGEGLFAGIADERRDRLTRLLGSLADDDAAALLQGLRAMRRAREAMLDQTVQMPSASTETPR
jgi:DNA-binding MarR family transcriptional regulator